MSERFWAFPLRRLEAEQACIWDVIRLGRVKCGMAMIKTSLSDACVVFWFRPVGEVVLHPTR